VTRRQVFGAALAAALARPALAAAEDRDGDIVKHLIAREEAAAYAYRGLRLPGLDDPAAQDTDHAKALRTQLQAIGRGTSPISVDQLDTAARRLAEASNRDQRLAAAADLEADLIADYRSAVIAIFEPGILQTVATILACHAQRRALLSGASYPA
jgi:uncharacterized sporulation protein YeaH/YhbH (DUF444 family)